MAAVAVVPLVPWTVRNYQTFGVVQPIAPRYANDPGEFMPTGFYRWVKTWMADYVSVENFYWNEGDAPMQVTDLPSRAFDSPEEYVRVKDLLDEYNLSAGMRVTPELDVKFAALAQERVERHPLRYYAWLPAVRVADMWLRPRTESLGIESTWWDWENDPSDSAKAIGLGLGNLAMILAALAGIALSIRAGGKTGEGWGAADGLPIRGLSLLLTFVALRSAFLGTLENPETRYTLECFPVVICLGAAALGQVKIPNCKRWLAGLVLRFQNKSATR